MATSTPTKNTLRAPTKSAARRRSRAVIAAALIAVAGAVAASALLGYGPWAPRREVSVFPSPGSRSVAPAAQISFRGNSLGDLKVTATGSRSGIHTGTIRLDSDADGASFLPAKPFTPGETVTVSTNQHLFGAAGGRFQFQVAVPAPPIPVAPLPAAPRVSGDVQRFYSEPSLAPAAVAMTKSPAAPSSGDIFLAPQQGPVQNGPMILDQDGRLVWFKPLPGTSSASDFRVQSYQGKPVLTWWQGNLGAGVGSGEDVIMDTSYRQIAAVRAGNGLSADLHEFKLTPRGTALITAYYPVYEDASSVHAASRQIVLDSVVQEIDIKTGLVLFQWDSLDHVPLTDSYTAPPKRAGAPLDYFHVNSVDEDRDGNLIISSRNTSAVYKVDRRTGKIIWRLGGKRSSFKIGRGASFAFQHDVRIRGDDTVTLFDNGGGPPRMQPYSQGMKLALDLDHMTATRTALYPHTPAVTSNFEGNVEQLRSGDSFVGWGQQPYFAEFNAHGQRVLDGRFVPATSNYRAYAFPWRATPKGPPAVKTSTADGQTVVYVSWNGATEVASWRVLAGANPSALVPVATASKQGFETAVTIRQQRYVAVQALDREGRVRASTAAVTTS
jgi:hypothetical protein